MRTVAPAMLLREDHEAVARAASEAATRWPGRVTRVSHLGSSANAVFAVEADGVRSVLRLTDPRFRTRGALEAELALLRILAAGGAAVGAPRPSASAAWVEEVECEGDRLFASSFEWAPGIRVDPATPQADDAFFRAWGRALGKVHRVAQSAPAVVAAARPHWRDRIWIAGAQELIPRDDAESLRELERLLAWADALGEDEGAFGVVHGDFGPQNFHYAAGHGVTVFDFDECGRDLLFTDLAVSLSTLLRLPRPERDRCRDLIFEGYRTEHPLREDHAAQLDEFLRLRAVYVYVSRLWAFGTSPDPHHAAEIARMRDVVHRAAGW